MPFYKFKDWTPVVHPSSYVSPQATLIGNVIIGEDVYIGPGAVLRGDWGKILIDRGANIQENCVVHMFPGTTVHLFENAHVGHGAIIHGATLKKNCLIGIASKNSLAKKIVGFEFIFSISFNHENFLGFKFLFCSFTK